MKGNQKTKTNTRGMLNVKGLDLEDDEDDYESSFQVSQRKKNKKTQKKSKRAKTSFGPKSIAFKAVQRFVFLYFTQFQISSLKSRTLTIMYFNSQIQKKYC